MDTAFLFDVWNCSLVTDQANNWEEALRLREKMESDNVPVTDFNLKRIALLLKRNNQPVPFEEPPVSCNTFYLAQTASGSWKKKSIKFQCKCFELENN